MTTAQKNIPAIRFPGFTGEWKTVKLGEIAIFSKGKGLSKSDIKIDGKLECIRYGELYTEYSEVIKEIKSRTDVKTEGLILSEYNDVIIPASGETPIDIATASCVQKSGVALGGDLNIIKTDLEGVFLSYYLNNKRKIDIARLSQGNSVVHLYATQLKSLLINVPEPPEQQKIADFLTEVDNKIQQLSKKKSLLEQYKKGMMQKLFSRELRFKDDKGKVFPDWEEKKIKDFAKVVTGNTPPTNDTENYGTEYLFVGPTDLGKATFIYDTEKKLSLKGFGLSRKFPKGSILFTCIGSTIGKSGIASVELTSNQQINAILPNAKYSSAYVFYYLFKIAPKIRLLAGVQAVPLINKTEFEKIKIIFPCLTEQKRIGDFLTSIDDKINLVQTEIEQTQQYKKGLLQQMFC